MALFLLFQEKMQKNKLIVISLISSQTKTLETHKLFDCGAPRSDKGACYTIWQQEFDRNLAGHDFDGPKARHLKGAR